MTGDTGRARPVTAYILIMAFLALGVSPASAHLQATRPSIQVHGGGSPITQIPFTLVDDHIVIPVSINHSPPIDMLLDTGMPMRGVILVDEERAARLDLEYSSSMDLGGGGGTSPRKARVATDATLSLSGFGFPGQEVFVIDDSGFADDWPAPGILGTTFFGHTVQIDFSASMICLYESIEDLPADPGHRFDLSFTRGIPVVEAAIAADNAGLLPVTLIVDTGVNAPLLVLPYSHQALEVPEDAVETRSGVLSEGLTGDISGRIGRVSSLRLGPYVLEEVLTAFPTRASMGHANILGQNGFIGTAVLKRFTVVFDYPNSHMYLRPNETYGEGFEWNMAGLLMGINQAGFLQVKDVVEGSPGADSGIEADDVITAMNGRDVRHLDNDTIQKLFNEEGAHLHLQVRRGSKPIDVTLTLRRII